MKKRYGFIPPLGVRTRSCSGTFQFPPWMLNDCSGDHSIQIVMLELPFLQSAAPLFSRSQRSWSEWLCIPWVCRSSVPVALCQQLNCKRSWINWVRLLISLRVKISLSENPSSLRFCISDGLHASGDRVILTDISAMGLSRVFKSTFLGRCSLLYLKIITYRLTTPRIFFFCMAATTPVTTP